MNLTSWLDASSTEDTNEFLFKLTSCLVESLPRDVGARISHLCDTGDIRALASLEIDYANCSLSTCRSLRQIRAFFEKRQDLDLGIDKREEALKTFAQTERRCLETNQLFKKVRRGSVSLEPCVSEVLHYAIRKTSEILGDLPSLSDLRFRFGPGATTGVSKKNAAPRVKLGMQFSCSGELAPYVDAVLGECPGWIPFGDSDRCIVDVKVEPGRITTVPKSWKTDRTISVEPLLNGFVQLGIGDFLRDRLLAFGIDIRDQTRNRKAACMGSVSGELATLDLSSASDCISIELMREMLPHDWFESLMAVRTGDVIVDGDRPTLMRLQKFSTMGNGFTFPLETLIFYSLAYGAVKSTGGKVSEISVYGDDIILPVQSYSLMCKVLNAVGFIPNREKSFASGPFRESCGADYLRGIDIRPVYVKGPLSGETLFSLHNAFRRRLEEELADLVLAEIPEHLRLFGPDGYGDGCLIPGFGKEAPLTPFRRKQGWSGFTFDVFSRKGRRLTRRNMPGDRFLPAYSIYSRNGLDDDTYDYRRTNMFKVEAKPLEYTYRKQDLSCPLPGSSGYRRLSIYTLTP